MNNLKRFTICTAGQARLGEALPGVRGGHGPLLPLRAVRQGGSQGRSRKGPQVALQYRRGLTRGIAPMGPRLALLCRVSRRVGRRGALAARTPRRCATAYAARDGNQAPRIRSAANVSSRLVGNPSGRHWTSATQVPSSRCDHMRSSSESSAPNRPPVQSRRLLTQGQRERGLVRRSSRRLQRRTTRTSPDLPARIRAHALSLTPAHSTVTRPTHGPSRCCNLGGNLPSFLPFLAGRCTTGRWANSRCKPSRSAKVGAATSTSGRTLRSDIATLPGPGATNEGNG